MRKSKNKPVTTPEVTTPEVTTPEVTTPEVTTPKMARALDDLESKKFEDWKTALVYIEDAKYLDTCALTLAWKSIYSCYGKRDFSSCLSRVNETSNMAKQAILKSIRKYDYRKCFSMENGKIMVSMPEVPILMPDDLKAIKASVNSEKVKIWTSAVASDRKSVKDAKKEKDKASFLQSLQDHAIQEKPGINENFYQTFIKLFDKSNECEKAFMANCLRSYYHKGNVYDFDNTSNAVNQDWLD